MTDRDTDLPGPNDPYEVEPGRVLVQVRAGAAHPVALEAAIHLAQALHSELEGLLFEDQQLQDLASFPFARELSFSGRHSRALSRDDLERDTHLALAAVRRRMEALARQARVPHRLRVVREEPLAALSQACSACAAWNVLALAEPFDPSIAARVHALITQLHTITGLLLVGPRSRRAPGPVVVALEEAERLPIMLRAAQQLHAAQGERIIIYIIAEGEEQIGHIEGQVRLTVGRQANISITSGLTTRGDVRVLAEDLRRLKSGFIIAEYGGILVPGGSDLRHLAAALECPMLIMR
ncbi:MAG: hypothetical protein AB7U66_11160 [Hyphomicrobiaceae bacterium]